jgi:2,3-bisphosphoglycerate-independent phosphoglycerate mutase
VTFEPQTGHDANPVPFYLVGPDFKHRRFAVAENLRNQTAGILADIAPTVLELLGVPQPPEMTGRSLLSDLL